MIYVEQLNSQPDILSILVLDDEFGSFERHAGTVQETRTKVVPYKREVQPWLHTRTSQIDGECRTVGDLEIHTKKYSHDRNGLHRGELKSEK